MAGISMREQRLSCGQCLATERAGIAGDKLGVEPFVFEVPLQLRDHADCVDRRNRSEGERDLLASARNRPGSSDAPANVEPAISA
ncbi:hypothetical protein BcanWSM471_07770 [Bradyrhizobium sp. WSM471]|nr:MULTISPECIES: hypothetical protein [Bradyrhizobium]UFW45164.1 hypothetical protein BcanWSM471_07770 [Bradyrhizobium canariense]